VVIVVLGVVVGVGHSRPEEDQDSVSGPDERVVPPEHLSVLCGTGKVSPLRAFLFQSVPHDQLHHVFVLWSMETRAPKSHSRLVRQLRHSAPHRAHHIFVRELLRDIMPVVVPELHQPPAGC